MKSNDLKGIQFHNQRERESKTNPNIDSERSELNYDLVNQEKINYTKHVNEIIESQKTDTRNIRKDAVMVNELLVTSDRGFFDRLDPDEQKRYFEESFKLFSERYGEKNIAYATVHLDEKTPHLHVGVVPMKDGKLQGKNVFNRAELRWIQDEFPKHMQLKGFDVERGKEGSDREHLKTQEFKAKSLAEQIMAAEQTLKQKMNEIQEIEKKTKEIEELPNNKLVFGKVMMNQEDHQVLVQLAKEGLTNGVVKAELEQEVESLQMKNNDLQDRFASSQVKLRNYYKPIEEENRELKVKFEAKVDHEVKRRGDQRYSNLVVRYNALAEREKEIVEKYNQKVAEKKELVNMNNKFIEKAKEYATAQINKTEQLKKENSVLKNELNQTQERLKKFDEFIKIYIPTLLKEHLSKIKTWLTIYDVDRDLLTKLSANEEKLAGRSLEDATKKVNKQLNPEKEKEHEIER